MTFPTALRDLHDRYVEAINLAVATGDEARVRELTDGFDVEVLDLMRESLAAA